MWITLTKAATGEAAAVNMNNVWRMEPASGGRTELHSLGANTGGVSASLMVEESIQEILQAMDEPVIQGRHDKVPPGFESTAMTERTGSEAADPGYAAREFYSSSNGDRWLLIRNPDTGHVFVRHEPNLSSGGQASKSEIAAFLSRNGHSPECQSLLRLIASLLD